MINEEGSSITETRCWHWWAALTAHGAAKEVWPWCARALFCSLLFQVLRRSRERAVPAEGAGSTRSGAGLDSADKPALLPGQARAGLNSPKLTETFFCLKRVKIGIGWEKQVCSKLKIYVCALQPLTSPPSSLVKSPCSRGGMREGTSRWQSTRICHIYLDHWNNQWE